MTSAVAAAAVETAATVEAAAAVESAADCAVADVSRTASDVAAAKAGATPVTGTAPVTRASVIAAAEPRAGADEQAAGEPARAVVPVGSASVGVVTIVAVGADGSSTHITGTDSDAHRETLSMSIRSDRQASAKNRQNHEVFHIWAPSEPVKPFQNLLPCDASDYVVRVCMVKHGRKAKVAVSEFGVLGQFPGNAFIMR